MPQNVNQPRSESASLAEAEPFPARWHLPTWLITALLAAVTITLYWPSLHDEFINCDDPDYFTTNVQVQRGLTLANVRWAFTTGTAANWHPLTWLSLMLDENLFGKNASGVHFTNIFLHAVDAVLLFWLLWILTGARWRSGCVAALFAWHPVHVESVAWAAERKDVLSAFFGFIALIFYARYARQSEDRGPRSEVGGQGVETRRKFYLYPLYWLAWFCFALGLMSKPMLVTWPFVLLLLDFWPLERWKSGRIVSLGWEKIPFFILAAAASLVTFLVQKHGGAVASMVRLPLEDRGANAMISYVRYLGKIFWPADLCVFYPRPAHWPPAEVLLAGVFLAGLSMWAWGQRRHYPFLLMGWLWYGGTLVPVIGLVQVGQQAMADRYAYIPSVGVFIMAVWGADELAKRWQGAVAALSMAASIAIILCLAVTRHQLAYWQNNEILFRHALAVTRDNFLAHCSLGMALHQAGRTDEAIEQFQQALRLQPNNAPIRNRLAGALASKGQINEAISQFHEALRVDPDYIDAHFDLANLLLDHGRAADAISEFQADLRLGPEDADAHYDLGKALLDQNQPDAAINEFQAAFRLKTYDAEVYYNLGNLLAKKGQIDAAIHQFKTAIHLKPDDADAYNNLGNLLARTGQTDAAISELQEALRLKPEDADTHYNLGNILLKTGRIDDTIRQFQEVIRLKPDYAPGHYNLGVALNKKGQADAAIGQFEEAIRRQPDYALAHNGLGTVLISQGRTDEAIHQFQAALQIKPDYASAQNNLTRAQALKNQPVVTPPAATKP